MKYHNQKTEVDGILFDSKLEAKRYSELKLLERAGEISCLQLQPDFELIPAFKKNGKAYRKTAYIADFMYFDKREQRFIVEDTKGFKTEIYKLKRKLFEFQYPHLSIREVTKE